MTEEYRKLSEYPKYRIYKDGRVYSEFINRFINATKDSWGYLQNTLVNNKGERKTIKNHRLVARAFLPNPYNYIEINHKDFNRTNNDISNLEWCNRLYNNRYTSINHLDFNSTSFKKLSPLSEEAVLLIPTLLKYGFSIKLISRLYNVGHITIRNIIKRKTWRWLKLDFNSNISQFNRDTINIPYLLYEELLKLKVDNTVLNSRIKVLESV